MLSNDAEAYFARRARRFAMLRKFMLAGSLTVARLATWRARSGRRGKSKGKATGGGKAMMFRTKQSREAKRAAFVGRIDAQRSRWKLTAPALLRRFRPARDHGKPQPH
jgi:hypothetical protein